MFFCPGGWQIWILRASQDSEFGEELLTVCFIPHLHMARKIKNCGGKHASLSCFIFSLLWRLVFYLKLYIHLDCSFLVLIICVFMDFGFLYILLLSLLLVGKICVVLCLAGLVWLLAFRGGFWSGVVGDDYQI